MNRSKVSTVLLSLLGMGSVTVGYLIGLPETRSIAFIVGICMIVLMLVIENCCLRPFMFRGDMTEAERKNEGLQ